MDSAYTLTITDGMHTMNRTQKLNLYCVGRKKRHVAEVDLGIKPLLLSYLLQTDLDQLIARIDALPVVKTSRRKVA
jgi:hypothetical protein